MPQNGWTAILIETAGHRGDRLFGRFSSDFCLGLPASFPNPFVGFLVLQRSRDDEQAFGNSAANRLVLGLTPKRHGHRRGFISAGIVVLAVDKNGYGNQLNFAVGCEL